MAGDHKCPVCQATFTRPQHVARHMRSHTGDRPYKCQYCGDQFARSDLLARHINKCHANEKPLPNTAPGGRRKGSAATSRATTSKQACDQCVQSSLPCDGSNPCSKCISRACRCTYIKFHRQTAPSGPGHHPPRSPSSSSSSSSPSSSIGPSRLSSHLDDFVLAPPPSAPPTGASSSSDQIFNTPFTLNPAAPPYPPNWTATDIPQLHFAIASDPDMAAKYHAHTEFLRRPDSSMLPGSSPTLLSSVYPTQQQQSPSTHWNPAWGEFVANPPLDDTKPFDGTARSHSLVVSEPPSFVPEFYAPDLIGSAYRPRRLSLEFSDSSSATSQSVPSSAASSNVHLPLSGSEMYDVRSEEMQREAHDAHILQYQRRSSVPTSSFPGPSEPSQPPLSQQTQRVGEGGFSSAFDLMSIDDPNVLVGLSSDEISFFSNLGMGVLPQSPNLTPMPTRVQHANPHQGRDRGMSASALPTPRYSKDAADTREVKDTWKTFVRSPLSVPDLSTLQSSSFAQVPQSPSGQRRRMKVLSLPSMTPTVENGHLLMMNGHGDVGASTVRTPVHGNPEDLRSYEAAVNARNPPLKLNLVPRRRGTQPSSSGSSPMEGAGDAGASLLAAVGQVDHQGMSRPSSSSSSSSWAQAFTVPTSQQQQHPHQNQNHLSHPYASVSGVVKPPPMQGASISLPIPPSMSMSGLHSSSHPFGHGHSHSVTFGSSTSLTFEPGSRASSVTSDGTGTGGSGSDGEVTRPSFKRCPSQTLGPANSKRAMVERGNGELKSVELDNGGLKGKECGRDGDQIGEMQEAFARVGATAGGGSPGSRPTAGLPERAKRSYTRQAAAS